MQPHTIVFIGPQGSGKGTQVRNITGYLESLGTGPVVNIETGKAFRSLAETASYTAARVKELLADGQMIPNFIAKAFIVKFLIKNLTPETHLTMDGFPRNVTQVQFLDDLMTFYKRGTLSVVYLDAPIELVKERLLARGRNDDIPELIEERLRLYQKDTAPVVEVYKARNDVNFIHIDATKSIEAIQQDIMAGLERISG